MCVHLYTYIRTCTCTCIYNLSSFSNQSSDDDEYITPLSSRSSSLTCLTSINNEALATPTNTSTITTTSPTMSTSTVSANNQLDRSCHDTTLQETKQTENKNEIKDLVSDDDPHSSNSILGPILKPHLESLIPDPKLVRTNSDSGVEEPVESSIGTENSIGSGMSLSSVPSSNDDSLKVSFFIPKKTETKSMETDMNESTTSTTTCINHSTLHPGLLWVPESMISHPLSTSSPLNSSISSRDSLSPHSTGSDEHVHSHPSSPLSHSPSPPPPPPPPPPHVNDKPEQSLKATQKPKPTISKRQQKKNQHSFAVRSSRISSDSDMTSSIHSSSSTDTHSLSNTTVAKQPTMYHSNSEPVMETTESVLVSPPSFHPLSYMWYVVK